MCGGLCGRKRANGKRMDVLLHHVAKRGVDHTLSLHSAAAFESIGNDVKPIVPTAFSGAGVAGMQGTLVLDLEYPGLEALGQDCAHALDGLRAHGKVLRKGRTVTCANTPARV